VGGPTFNFRAEPFYFLRHGETRERRAGILQGQNETELNRSGRDMAEAAAEAVIKLSLGSIYASPLRRAWRTASIISVLTNVPVHALPGLMERHWGDYQGLPIDRRPAGRNPRGVESEEDFERRVIEAMESIKGPAPVLVVAHSGVFRAICHYIGFGADRPISVASGQVLRMEPPTGTGQVWSISIV